MAACSDMSARRAFQRRCARRTEPIFWFTWHLPGVESRRRRRQPGRQATPCRDHRPSNEPCAPSVRRGCGGWRPIASRALEEAPRSSLRTTPRSADAAASSVNARAIAHRTVRETATRNRALAEVRGSGAQHREVWPSGVCGQRGRSSVCIPDATFLPRAARSMPAERSPVVRGLDLAGFREGCECCKRLFGQLRTVCAPCPCQSSLGPGQGRGQGRLDDGASRLEEGRRGLAPFERGHLAMPLLNDRCEFRRGVPHALTRSSSAKTPRRAAQART